MRLSTKARVAVLSAAFLALPVMPAPPAAASFVVGATNVFVGYWNNGASGCGTTSTTDDEDTNDLVPPTGAHSYSKTGSQHFDGGSLGDTVDFAEKIDSDINLVPTANGFAKLSVNSTSSVTTTVGNALSDCAPVRANAQASSMATFTTTTPGWLMLTATGTGTGTFTTNVQLNVESGSGASLALGRTISGPLNTTRYLPKGEYQLILQATAFSAATASTNKAHLAGQARFVRIGVALAASTGKGRTDVVLPSSLNCTTHRAKVKVTRKGAKRKHPIVFQANGSERKRIRHPHKRTVTLTKIPARGPVTLSAATGHGSVQRTYAGCGE